MKRWFNIALANFAIAAIIGVFLRGYYIWDITLFRFKALLNAHSHVAMLGWAFIAMVVFILKDETPKGPSRTSLGLLVLAQAAVIGMLLGFPVQSYGAFTIAVSVLHMLASYFLGVRIWKVSKPWRKNGSRMLVRMAVVMMYVSTIGVWAMWPIIEAGKFGTEIYYWSIQFYLHFQLNGWFWFGGLALWSRWAETNGARYVMDRFTIRLWVVSVILTFALAIAWSERHWLVYSVNSLGVVLQLWAGWRTARSIFSAQRTLMSKAPLWAWRCVTYALAGMGLKVVMQAAVAVPQVAIMAFTVRNLTIGFIHLNTLACISMMLFAMALLNRQFSSTSSVAKVGLSVFTSGMIISEAILFLQGAMFWFGLGKMPAYYELIFGFSALLPLGTIILLAHSMQKKEGVPEVA
ncbi:MAG TPA: hypothetical protein PKD45_10010 [Flavobacteriales bacterium]|nr:hypothetical protein [Flavobacteriales bacterium]